MNDDVKVTLSWGNDVQPIALFIKTNYKTYRDVPLRTIEGIVSWACRHGLCAAAWRKGTLLPLALLIFRPTDDVKKSNTLNLFYLAWEGNICYVDMYIDQGYVFLDALWACAEASIGKKEFVAFERENKYDSVSIIKAFVLKRKLEHIARTAKSL